MLTDRLFKGVVIGVLSTLAVGLLILIIVWIVRLIPAPSGRESAIPDADPSCPEQNVAARADKGAESVSEGEVYEYGIPLSRYRKVEGNIRKGEFFSTLMTRLGASQSDIYALDALSKGVFDMRQIKVGYHYHAYYLPGEPDTLAQVVYEKDNASYVVFTLRDSLSVRVEDKDIVNTIDYVEVEIENSLWQDIIDAGAPALLAVSLADIYAWSIDFFGLQKGDSFKAVYEKSECDGEVLNVERVLYAEFTHGDQAYKSYWFDDGSGNYYWNIQQETSHNQKGQASYRHRLRGSGGNRGDEHRRRGGGLQRIQDGRGQYGEDQAQFSIYVGIPASVTLWKEHKRGAESKAGSGHRLCGQYRVFHRSSSGFPYLEERHAYQPAEDGVSPGRASVKGRHACVPQEHGRVRDRRRPFRCAYGAETDGGNY